ncbi:MAG: beta-lactamase family protein [Ignavibacteria bacterium]|nr:beta-lactamase family protein [Ignavibacteria bacterium]
MKKNIHLLIAAIFVIQISFNTNISGQTSADRDVLLKKITELKEETKVKSLITGIKKGDEEILTIALGESMTSVPASADMHIRIGGVSEIFFGTLLMILSEKGEIDIDEKISKWMPELLAADKVTPLMLIKNTAGYKDYVLNKDFVDLVTKEPFRNFSREEIIAYSVGGGELNFTPGTDQKYSHTEFTILGKVIERATGKKMPELYEEYIFSPLNLQNTGYSVNQELPSPVLHAFSSDRGIYEDATYWNPSWTGDSGPLYSNLNDLIRFARAFGKGSLLTPASFERLVSRPEGAKNPDLYFASGFVVANGWYAQNPSFNGYSGAFGYLPEDDLTVIVFTTQSDDPKSDAQAFKILKEIVKIISPEKVINF